MMGASTAYFDVFFVIVIVSPSLVASDDAIENIIAFNAVPLQQTIALALFCQFPRNPLCVSFV
jgi:hypothetical protein